MFVSSFFCRRCELGDVDFRPSKNAFTRDHHHRDPILDLFRTTISFSSIASNKKTPTPTTPLITSAQKEERERERERERDEVGARTTCACAACVAELSDTAAATTAETAFPAMVTIGFAAGVLSQSSSSLREARIIVDGDGRRAGRRDPATTRAAARPPVKLVMRVVVDDDDTAMICVFFFFFSKGKCHKQYTRVRVNK